MKTQDSHIQTHNRAAAEPTHQQNSAVSLPAVPVLQQKEETPDADSTQEKLMHDPAEAPPPSDAPFKPAVTAAIQRVSAERPAAPPTFRTMQLKKEDAPEGMHSFQPLQRQPNHTGLPDTLKSGIEQVSGMDISDVKVHYNSSKPATVQAHAYAQGTDIHVAPGQEAHLPHEAWHVVQQKQGRVQPTMEVNGMSVNDSPALEKEADDMGAQAIQRVAQTAGTTTSGINTLDLHKELHGVARHLDGRAGGNAPVQMQAAGVFIKEDDAEGNQMAKSVFLDKMKTQITAVADDALKPHGQTAADCPFIDYWIGFYQDKTAGEIEKALHVYVPESESITDADTIVSVVADKVNTRLREQLEKSGLNPSNTSSPDKLTDKDGEVTAFAPTKQLKEDGVVQRGFLRSRLAPPNSDDFADMGEYDEAQKRFAALPANEVRLPNMPRPGDGPRVAGFTPNNIVFISSNSGGVGSIYFPTGRIRLEHGGGPEISQHQNIQRFAVSDDGMRRYYQLRKAKVPIGTRYTTLLSEGFLTTAAGPGVAGTILEFMGIPPTTAHPSGGTPANINTVIAGITQDQVNILCAGAESRNNAVLRQYMDTDPGLRAIPTSASR
jgi:hypothetical protein